MNGATVSVDVDVDEDKGITRYHIGGSLLR
jgi:hypothetical protein